MSKAKRNKLEELDKLEIDKEKLIKELKEEVKDGLFDEIAKKVDYESKNKLDKMEKRIYKYKNFSILKRNIIILLFLCVIIFETKILYDNNLLFGLKNKEEKNNIENKEPNKVNDSTEEEIKDLNWYIKEYEYLLDNVNTNLKEEDRYYLYKKNYTESNIRNSVRLNMAYQILDNNDKQESNSVISVDGKKLKEAYKKIFGTTSNYKPENFNDNCIQFIYNDTTDSYMAISTTCEKTDEEIIREIENIKEEEDKIIFEVFVGIYNKGDKTLSNIDGTLVKKDYSSDDLDSVKNKLSKYTFTFEKIEKEYYLKEIKKD